MNFGIKTASTADRKHLFDVFVTLEKMSDSHQSAIHKFIQWYLNETRGHFKFLVKSTWDEQWQWMKITVMYGKAVIIKLKSFGKPERSEYPTEDAFNKAINCLTEIEDAIKEHFGDDGKISAPTWDRESIEEFGSGPSWNDIFNGQFKVKEEREHAKLGPERPLYELDLSIRAFNALRRSGYETVKDVMEANEADILAIRNVGKKTLNEILEKIEVERKKMNDTASASA